MQKAALTEETFVRELSYSTILKLAEFLDQNNLWEQLASKIPIIPDILFSNHGDNFQPRYTMAHIMKFSNSRSSTKALIIDWGTQNCKIKHLIKALYQAELIAPAAYIEQNVLHIESSSKNVIFHQRQTGFSGIENTGDLPVTIDGKKQEINMQKPPCVNQQLGLSSFANEKHPMNSARKDIQLHKIENTLKSQDDEHLKDIPLNILQEITNNFDMRIYKDGGNRIGEGGFGTVFIGVFCTGFNVAVKCLKDSSGFSVQQFKTEVETLCTFKHENLVHLLGYSSSEDGPRCLIYQYLTNGSLEERLACLYDTQPLSNNIRLKILQGTARGIAFLHKGGLVHRDIKSANILLDDEFNPKVGDFATARMLPLGITSQIMKTSVIIGTAAYLAPEALSFVIHPSLDIYSFGVVVLEILTGLPVTDSNREEKDLKFYVQEHCSEGEDGEESGSILDLLDKNGGEWTKSVVDQLYSLSCRCLEYVSKKRPQMADIVTELEQLDHTDTVL